MKKHKHYKYKLYNSRSPFWLYCLYARIHNFKRRLFPYETNGIMNQRGLKRYCKKYMNEENNHLLGQTKNHFIGHAIPKSNRGNNIFIIGNKNNVIDHYILPNLINAKESAVAIVGENDIDIDLLKKYDQVQVIDLADPNNSCRLNIFSNIAEGNSLSVYLAQRIYALLSKKESSEEDRKNVVSFLTVAISYYSHNTKGYPEKQTFAGLRNVINLIYEEYSGYPEAIRKYSLNETEDGVHLINLPNDEIESIGTFLKNIDILQDPIFECFTERTNPLVNYYPTSDYVTGIVNKIIKVSHLEYDNICGRYDNVVSKAKPLNNIALEKSEKAYRFLLHLAIDSIINCKAKTDPSSKNFLEVLQILKKIENSIILDNNDFTELISSLVISEYERKSLKSFLNEQSVGYMKDTISAVTKDLAQFIKLNEMEETFYTKNISIEKSKYKKCCTIVKYKGAKDLSLAKNIAGLIVEEFVGNLYHFVENIWANDDSTTNPFGIPVHFYFTDYNETPIYYFESILHTCQARGISFSPAFKNIEEAKEAFEEKTVDEESFKEKINFYFEYQIFLDKGSEKTIKHVCKQATVSGNLLNLMKDTYDFFRPGVTYSLSLVFVETELLKEIDIKRIFKKNNIIILKECVLPIVCNKISLKALAKEKK